MATTQDELLGEVLTLLCERGMYWATCTDTVAGLSAAALLPLLVTAFPGSAWDATKVTTTLEYGVRRGALTTCTNVTPVTYLARRDMARVNPRNEQYRTVCAGIYAQLPQPNQYFSP
jgi:hypothetical protein